MARGEGRTLDEAFDRWAEQKSKEVRSERGVDELSFAEGLEVFEEFHPVTIELKVRPANQWVKGFRVSDAGGGG